MDMTATHPEQRLFVTTGRRERVGVDAIDALGLRPVAFARYRDLAGLRYDYPLVLSSDADAAVRSVSSIVDTLLRDVAPRGAEGELLRRHVLRLERELRTLAAAGEQGTLGELWERAAARISPPGDLPSVEVLLHIAGKLPQSVAVVDCDASTPSRLVDHLWQAAHRRKARTFRALVDRLLVRLADVRRAAYLRSAEGQRPESLRAAVGGPYRDAFDFDVMSKLVARATSAVDLDPARRVRIDEAIRVLGEQSFYPAPDAGDEPSSGAGALRFRFDDCASAAQAYRDRLPQLADVVKAIAIAELEVDGRYAESKHDPFFRHFDASALTPEDIALFPDYLVCIAPGSNDAPENAGLMDLLSAGLPVKVLVEATDLAEEAVVGTGRFAFGVRSMRLAHTATGLGGVFVVQTASSNLYALAERIDRAFSHRGPALFSVYVGTAAPPGGLPCYLIAAAAMESRAFPAFSYDPYAGDNQAARFALEDNPQPEADWPVSPLEYADEALQRVVEETPFTIADFLLCDTRYAGHFARVPRERWNASMVPADEWLARDPATAADLVPFVVAVDDDDVLQRVIVDARLMQIVARGRTFWHRLQEEGGIHNSHAAILLAREKAKWEEARAKESAAAEAAAGESLPAAGNADGATKPDRAEPPAPTAPVAEARDPDEAWIETARCPSCNECQTINDRMFRYNENKQAYIADIGAGTFRQLVEAAEVCQVAIIHPGKPRNPAEPGLAELIERAQQFQ